MLRIGTKHGLPKTGGFRRPATSAFSSSCRAFDLAALRPAASFSSFSSSSSSSSSLSSSASPLSSSSVASWRGLHRRCPLACCNPCGRRWVSGTWNIQPPTNTTADQPAVTSPPWSQRNDDPETETERVTSGGHVIQVGASGRRQGQGVIKNGRDADKASDDFAGEADFHAGYVGTRERPDEAAHRWMPNTKAQEGGGGKNVARDSGVVPKIESAVRDSPIGEMASKAAKTVGQAAVNARGAMDDVKSEVERMVEKDDDESSGETVGVSAEFARKPAMIFGKIHHDTNGKKNKKKKQQTNDMTTDLKETMQQGKEMVNEKWEEGKEMVKEKMSDMGLKSKLEEGAEMAKEKTGDMAKGLKKSVVQGAGKAKSMMEDGKEMVKEKMGDMNLKSKMKGVKSAVTEKAEDAKEFANEKFEQGKEMLEEEAGDVRTGVMGKVEMAKEKVEQAKDKVTEVVHRVGDATVGDMVKGVGAVVGAVGRGVMNVASMAKEKLSENANNDTVKDLRGKVEEAKEKMGDLNLNEKWEEGKEMVQEKMKDMKSKVMDVKDKVTEQDTGVLTEKAGKTVDKVVGRVGDIKKEAAAKAEQTGEYVKEWMAEKVGMVSAERESDVVRGAVKEAEARVAELTHNQDDSAASMRAKRDHQPTPSAAKEEGFRDQEKAKMDGESGRRVPLKSGGGEPLKAGRPHDQSYAVKN